MAHQTQPPHRSQGIHGLLIYRGEGHQTHEWQA
jgi:hypothetical protein